MEAIKLYSLLFSLNKLVFASYKKTKLFFCLTGVLWIVFSHGYQHFLVMLFHSKTSDLQVQDESLASSLQCMKQLEM